MQIILQRCKTVNKNKKIKIKKNKNKILNKEINNIKLKYENLLNEYNKIILINEQNIIKKVIKEYNNGRYEGEFKNGRK